MKQPGVLQTFVWLALGTAALVFLNWRNEKPEDHEDHAAAEPRTDSASAGANAGRNTMPSPAPRPFAMLKPPAVLKPPALLKPPAMNTKTGSTVERPARMLARAGDSIGVSVTAYCLRGTTRSGVPAGEGVVAADPRVFPLNSDIELHVGGQLLGIYRVADTGLLVKGRIIDLWVPDCKQARQFGRKRGIAVLVPKIRR